jgi:hypothetical protein
MRVLPCKPKRLDTAGHKHQVDMVRHQAVPHHNHPVEGEALLEQIEIDPAIRIGVDNEPAVIPTLRHVGGYPPRSTGGRRAMALPCLAARLQKSPHRPPRANHQNSTQVLLRLLRPPCTP